MWIDIIVAFLILVAIVLLCVFSLKIDLFLVSFMPLFLIILIKVTLESEKDSGKSSLLSKVSGFFFSFKSIVFTGNFFWITILALCIVPIFVFWFHLSWRKKSSIVSFSVSKIEHLDDSIVSYVMTYIVPLTSLSYSSQLSEYVSNISLFILIMILYIRLDLVYLNPVLMLRWNIFRAVLDGENRFVITKLTYAQFDSKAKNEKTKYDFQKLSNSLYLLNR